MAELLVLRLVHILGGLFWVGAGLFTTFFLAPALKASGPAAGGVVMGHLLKRHMMTIMPIVALLTILSGIRLMWIVSAASPHWFQHAQGHTYSVAGALSIIAFLTGIFVVRPTMNKAGRLSQSAASDGASREMLTAEIAKLQKRATMSSGIATTFLVLAAAGMAIARYL